MLSFLFQFSSFVVYVRTHTYSLSLLYKDDLHVLHGVAEQQRSIEDGVICDSHEIVSEIFERLDHGYVVFISCRKIEFSFARVCCGSQN